MSDDLELQMPTDLRRNHDAVPLVQRDEVSQGPYLETNPKQTGILRLTVDTPPTSSPKTVTARPPPRWRTPEFLFYGVCFVLVVPIMVWKPIQMSRESDSNYPIYSGRLSNGWLFGRKIDNSDAQYRSFRNNLPLLALIASALLSANFLYKRLFRPSSNGTHLFRIPFIIFSSLIFIFGLHGYNIFKILFIICINYGIAKSLRASKLLPLVTWVFNMAVLFAIERNSGYRYAGLSPSLAYLDSFQGAYPRWYIPFNFSMLRLVSFSMDYHWACRRIGVSPTESQLQMDHRQRTTTCHDLEIYNFKNYIAYLLYPPLFIAGPIMTFNDFMWQHLKPSGGPSRRMVVSYLVRFVFCVLTMEFVLHYIYVVAIKDTSAWKGDSPFELSMIGFWNLAIVWLKLLIPWRFFRLWALADGIDPPENMIRCMVNNYSTLGFWRAWHRSYNLWIVRYIYIPLGGTNNLLVSTVLIFSFVALWHDLTFRLLAWGWLVSLFIVPEVTARYFFPPGKYGNRPWYRHVCAIGGVFNIMMMMIANLVGFVVGVDGIQFFLQQLFGTSEGLRFLFLACVVLFIDNQVLFEYREEEMRNGIYRKC